MNSNAEKTALDILASALSDVGAWTWWVDTLPEAVQLEFGWVMLYQPSKDTARPPSSQVALYFRKPRAVMILMKADCALPDHWLDRLHEDLLEPLNVSHGQLSFDSGEIRLMLEEADEVETLFGEPAYVMDASRELVKMGFWAGEVGMVIVAEDLRVLTHQGEIQLSQIPERSEAWWQYWQRYWEVRETAEALPYDWLCEITIPAAFRGL